MYTTCTDEVCHKHTHTHTHGPGVNILRKSVNSSGTAYSYTKNSTNTMLYNFNQFWLPQIYLATDSVFIY